MRSTDFSSPKILIALVTLSMDKITWVSFLSHNFEEAPWSILVASIVLSQGWLDHNFAICVVGYLCKKIQLSLSSNNIQQKSESKVFQKIKQQHQSFPHQFWAWYVWADMSRLVSRYELNESEGGQMGLEKVKWAYSDAYLSQTMWNQAKKPMKRFVSGETLF